MAKYNTYINLNPHYESVVDLSSEERNPNLWLEYIVHKDMQTAVEKICESFKNDKPDSRRSFWVDGVYGTGKSYSALVIKHLFEDTVPKISKFLSHPLLMPNRDKFVAIREKGEFLVVWKTGCTDIRSGSHLLMELELEIRKKLEEKFGAEVFYGSESLITTVQEKLKDKSLNWQNIFMDPKYGLTENYASFEEFRDEVLDRNLNACDTASNICRDKGFALLGSLRAFLKWIEDVIEGNHLEKTGIVIIWDEFTAFVRDRGDDNVLQQLSEFCKQQPFFMFLIVHVEPNWVTKLGEKTYKKILDRYHRLEFEINEIAAYDLIGNSIITRLGMDDQWNDVKDNLMKPINVMDFDNLDMGNTKDRIRQLCPIHPMTLSLLAIVAQNFGASQRTLFRFLKDDTDSDHQVGFIHFIDNFGPDDWKWLTPDFLWDYFFTHESDIYSFSTEARHSYHHFENKKDELQSSHKAMHVFKAAMLLMAVVSTGKISQLRSGTRAQQIAATRNTLYKCFTGQLAKDDVEKYLNELEEIGILRLDQLSSGDARIELPYTGNVDLFDNRFDRIKTTYTRHMLFKKGGVFSKALEEKMWDKNKSTFPRMQIIACSSETLSLKTRLEDLYVELDKYAYKIGILVVSISEPSEYAVLQSKLQDIASKDRTRRLVVCMVKSPLSKDQLEKWYTNMTHKELAAEASKKKSADDYEDKASINVEEWASLAAVGQITAFYGNTHYSEIYGSDMFLRQVEADVIYELFSAAPERIVSQNTAFKRSSESAVVAAIERKASTSQIRNIADALQGARVWDVRTIEELKKCNFNVAAEAVATLATFIDEKFTEGKKVKIDELWLKLRGAPFGYYDSLACAYLLGFVMRFYVKNRFNWVDNDNNTFPLNEKHMTTMIKLMCKDKVFNNTISSGSEIWQKFLPYAARIFNLTDRESASDENARKYMRERIISAGTPFWVLKYVSEEKLGGPEQKDIVCKIVDWICAFIAQVGDQEIAMESITTLFKSRGDIKQIIIDLFADKSERYKAFKTFILQNDIEIEGYIDSIGISPDELFHAIKGMMPGYIYLWTEQEVAGNLIELVYEYQLINVLNAAMGVHYKTMTQLCEDLSNRFEHMKVPGSVIEQLDKPWIPALTIMSNLSSKDWANRTIDQKQEEINVLLTHARYAWEHIKSSRLLLVAYLEMKNIKCTESETNGIYADLKNLTYDTPEVTFQTEIEAQMKKVSYERDKSDLQELWRQRSGEQTIDDWCKKYMAPIQWVVNAEARPYIETVKTIQGGRQVENTQMRDAVQFFRQNELNVLQDMTKVRNLFFAQIGDSNREAIDGNEEEIFSRIRIKLGGDVSSWAFNTGEIRSIIESFIREKMAEQWEESAKESVLGMSENDLRKRVISLLNTRPELYKIFLDLEG
jgi:hypothetical protein